VGVIGEHGGAVYLLPCAAPSLMLQGLPHSRRRSRRIDRSWRCWSRRRPTGDDWLHELKLDGFRIGVEIDHGTVRLLSRREKEWTAEFPTVVAGAKSCRRRRADRR
jgi:bifunctional non-homologous end joining protein LigD